MCILRVLSWHGTAVSSMLGVARHPQRGKETAVLDTFPRAGVRLQSATGASAGVVPQPPDAAQVAGAVARFLAPQRTGTLHNPAPGDDITRRLERSLISERARAGVKDAQRRSVRFRAQAETHPAPD